jgi:UMP-CMP kinase
VVRQAALLQTLTRAALYARRYPDVAQQLADDSRRLRAKINDPWLARQADVVLGEWDAAERRAAAELVVVFVVGGPGVGKGTQCEEAARHFGFGHVSVGELLRRERERPGSPYRDFIDRSFREHVPVPPALAMRLLREELPKPEADGIKIQGMILDGFPLTVKQLQAFEEEVGGWPRRAGFGLLDLLAG